MSEQPHVVVCGAGIIGAAIAQALARRGTPPTIVDSSGVASSASGKAGGFLALDWNDDTPLGALARRSFALHRELAETLDAGWGYRPVETLAAAAGQGTGAGPADWLDGAVVRGVVGTAATTAQVDPRRLTAALVDDAVAHGATLVAGRVEAVAPPGKRRTVTIDGETMAGDVVVVALGPWTGHLGLPIPDVGALKGASITLAASVPAQAVFSQYISEDGRLMHPEIYPRADDEVYVCGVPSSDVLPATPEEVRVDDDDCRVLEAMAAAHSSVLAEASVTARQACFRPVTGDGLPLIGPVGGDPSLIVATGHGPWGILNAPATGEMVAEMILDGGPRTVDAAPYSPGRGGGSGVTGQQTSVR